MISTKTKWAAGAIAALTLAAGAPMAAQAQSTQYDGYCYAKQGDAKTTGTVVGAIAGGLLGSQISKNERGLGAVGGAVAGGAIGRQIGKSSVKCYNGEYYSYQTGQYTPAAAPDGYQVVYYNQRPDSSAYSRTYYDPDRRSTSPSDRYAYNAGYNQGYNNGYNNGSYNNNDGYQASNSSRRGWRDTGGTWHMGTPQAYGWRDDRGVWHEGQFQSYGWQDSRGAWHESTTSSSTTYSGGGYNGGSN